ncbi:MAG TPA: hypothetical protein VLE95_06405 [Chlamydiales bacterium]|nr:hypothetical protein [Chlamydiales bacterium]
MKCPFIRLVPKWEAMVWRVASIARSILFIGSSILSKRTKSSGREKLSISVFLCMWYHAADEFKYGGYMNTKTARLTIDMERSEHKRLKMVASMMGTTIKNLILMSVEEFMQKKPNKVTLKAMKQSEGGKGLKKFRSLDEMLEDLGV